MSHVWYMPMIIGLYALIPFVANSLQVLDEKNLYGSLACFIQLLCSFIRFCLYSREVLD